ncbi:MAG: D-glycero-beta-D-manno-heptose 1,7-bisphosphate 7-phosphatase [Chloroflexota bacterium]|nr:D-glycero-beta-D-manno-heptose 1,7-bisphosphate 7-phosphatase [Chloroflexota bacterium]
MSIVSGQWSTVNGGGRRAVFLDRDGVINENRADYVRSWADVEFLPGVFPALERLAASDLAIVVITNQSPVGRGILTMEEMNAINDALVARIRSEGGRIDAVYACPHRPEDDCTCRKPRPGMLLQAAKDMDIDLGASFLVGDAVTDIEAGLRAGCRPVMVRTGRGESQLVQLRAAGYELVPVADDLAGAVTWIFDSER